MFQFRFDPKSNLESCEVMARAEINGGKNVRRDAEAFPANRGVRQLDSLPTLLQEINPDGDMSLSLSLSLSIPLQDINLETCRNVIA